MVVAELKLLDSNPQDGTCATASDAAASAATLGQGVATEL